MSIALRHQAACQLRHLAPHSLGGIYRPPNRAQPAHLLDLAPGHKAGGYVRRTLISLRNFHRLIDLRLEKNRYRAISLNDTNHLALRPAWQEARSLSEKMEALGTYWILLSRQIRQLEDRHLPAWLQPHWHRTLPLGIPMRVRHAVATGLALFIAGTSFGLAHPAAIARGEGSAGPAPVVQSESTGTSTVEEGELQLSEPGQLLIDRLVHFFSQSGRQENLARDFRHISSYPIDPLEKDLRHQQFAHLPATVAYFEKIRPPKDWLEKQEPKQLSRIYAPTPEYWRDQWGNVQRIERGFAITKIPAELAPLYEYVEHTMGISRYVLMAIATIESKQGKSFVSPTNCQGWGHYCPGTVRLFQNKHLLPRDFDSYDKFDGIAGISVHLWVSSMGVTRYNRLMNQVNTQENPEWPVFWSGETPSYSLFQNHSWQYPIIPATWGYNRSHFYGYSVAKLARFYREHDVVE